MLLCSVFVIGSCAGVISYWCCVLRRPCVFENCWLPPSRWQTGRRVVNCNSFRLLLRSVYVIRCYVGVVSYWCCVQARPCVFENYWLPPADGRLVEGLWIVIPLVCYCVLFSQLVLVLVLYHTRSYAALRAADLGWIVGPGYSPGG